MTTLNVNLAERSYQIVAGQGAFADALSALSARAAGGSKLVCVADAAVLRLHPAAAQKMRAIAEIIPVEGGEASKSFSKLAEICSLLARANVDRKSALAAWGGGVIGDLSGFAAASYMRGIDFYQIPTTLLAMVDSSVGGKTGINIAEGKNLVGAFHQPRGVFADTDFLKTLPAREFSAGLAEVVKCGVLGDAQLFADIESLPEKLSPAHPYLPEAIRRCCALKAAIVAADERESAPSGGRALLNFGHTFGHAIENTAGYGKYLHGEAVAVGMLMAAALSKNLGFADIRARLKAVLEKCGLPASSDCGVSGAEFMRAISRDKKNAGGRKRFVLAQGIGAAKTAEVAEADVLRVLEEFSIS